MIDDTSHIDHALAEEFAGQADIIHRLKAKDPHFARLMQINHQLWLEIKNAETGVSPVSDEELTSLRKRRLAALDDIGAAINAEAGGR